MQRFTMEVAGMTCDDCNRHVQSAVEAVGGRNAEADWRTGSVAFAADRALDPDRLEGAVREVGYEPGTLITHEPNDEQTFRAPRPDGPVDHDLLIIGGGSAAFAAAITATEAGARVAVVEHGATGGTCVNVGCVPSKALLRAAEVYHEAGTHGFAGVETSAGRVDLAALVAQKDELVATMRREKYEDLIPVHGFELIHGHAAFIAPDAVAIDGRTVTASAFLIATGASPSVPPIEGLEDAGFLTSTTALELREVPERLAVIGANAIGLELGQYFSHLGSRVVFIEALERIAPFEEPEVSEILAEVLREEGAEVHTSAKVVRVTGGAEGRTVHAEVGGAMQAFPVDQVLVATGRTPNTRGLGLEIAGIETGARGAIVVDARQRTTNPRVWAAGDVTDAPQFVYVSAYAGRLAAENAIGDTGRTSDLRGLPRVTFTTPQAASAGLTEAQALAEGRDVTTSTLPLSAVPRAIVNRDVRGVIKLVADASTDELLGASILAEGAGEAIQAAVVAIRARVTVSEIADTFHPYLTIAEGLKLAAQTFRKDVATLSCCAA